MRLTQCVSVLLAMLALGVMPRESEAQFGGLRRRAEEEAKRKAAQAAAEAAVRSAVDTAKAKSGDSTAAQATQNGAVADTAPAASSSRSAAPKSDPKVWENYDFVPGNKVIFFTDFSEDRVGNFARGLKYRSGPLEVVERDGLKMLRSTGRAEFLIPVGKRLPERFTLEFDVITAANALNDAVSFEGGPQLDRGDKSGSVTWNPRGAFIIGGGQNGGMSQVTIPEVVQQQLIAKVAHLRVLMDSGYFKMYVNERRIYNIPELAFVRDSVIRVLVTGGEEADKVLYLTSIRVAESETDVLYDALAAKGRWSTHGILFATGKADVQPESRPVLKDIAATLQQHADLKVLIEGHTDNVGSAASNLTLSDARAAAVKAALVADYGVDASRVTTKGLGDTKPAVPNSSSAGRAQNRRVEVVKQ